MSVFSRTNRSFLANWWWTVDHLLLTLVIVLIVFGVFLVMAASPSVAIRVELNEYHFLIKHLIFLIPSLFLIIFLSFLNVRNIWRVAVIILFISFILMLLVLGFGEEVKGAKRWIQLPFMSLQPSEFAKPSFLIVTSWFIAKHKENSTYPGMKISYALFGIVIALLIAQPDMGMSVVTTTGFITILVLSGLPFRKIVYIMFAFVLLSVLAYYTMDHVRDRVNRHLHPETSDTYQIDKSLEAFENGGLFGTGPGQGTVKMTIPDAHADFIFSVAGEELGLFFIIILVGIYGAIILRGFARISDSDNLFVIYAVGSILTIFGLQALIHMGSSLGLIPTKGMTLPFISYGGSSLLSMSISFGMVLGLTRRHNRTGISQAGIGKKSIHG